MTHFIKLIFFMQDFLQTVVVVCAALFFYDRFKFKSNYGMVTSVEV